MTAANWSILSGGIGAFLGTALFIHKKSKNCGYLKTSSDPTHSRFYNLDSTGKAFR